MTCEMLFFFFAPRRTQDTEICQNITPKRRAIPLQNKTRDLNRETMSNGDNRNKNKARMIPWVRPSVFQVSASAAAAGRLCFIMQPALPGSPENDDDRGNISMNIRRVVTFSSFSSWCGSLLVDSGDFVEGNQESFKCEISFPLFKVLTSYDNFSGYQKTESATVSW